MIRLISSLALLITTVVGLAASPLGAQIDDGLSIPVTEAEAGQERIMTDLLNQLGRQGFTNLRAVRREGSGYVVDVVDRDLRLRTFRLELDSGSIFEIQ